VEGIITNVANGQMLRSTQPWWATTRPGRAKWLPDQGIALPVGQEAVVGLRLRIGEITEEVVITDEVSSAYLPPEECFFSETLLQLDFNTGG